jgi:catechol 2,3-dioxygenase
MVIGRLAHVALGADDPEMMAEFYAALLGVVEVSRNDTTLFLAGGKKPGYDLALSSAVPRGLDHFAFAVASARDLELARESLAGAGADPIEIDPATEYGISRGLRFVLPSGHIVELVVEADPQVFPGTSTIAYRHFRGVGPVCLEHVSINCDAIEETARFLVDHLGFAITEYSQHGIDPWFLAFLRCRELHHDLGIFHDPEWIGPGFNHVAFAVPSAGELVRAADVAYGLGHKLQCSPGRHLVGDNVFIYVVDPEGNRIEIATPLVHIDPAAPIKAFDASSDEDWQGFDGWRDGVPPAARWPSACRDGRSDRS